MRKLLAALICYVVLFCSTLYGQKFVESGDRLLRGFEKKIEGGLFKYDFPMPGIDESLLIRGNGEGRFMEYETEVVPKDYTNKSALFVIPIGMGSGGKVIGINFSINGKKEFSFDTKAAEKWSLEGDDGKSLSYENLSYDVSRDTRGLLYLRVPTSQLTLGKPLTIKIEADKADVTTWFMTFTNRIIPKLEAKLSPGIITTPKGDKQIIFVNVVHFAPTEKATIKLDGKVLSKQDLKLGYNTIQVEVDRVTESKNIKLEVITADKVDSKEIVLKPSRDWKVNFVNHSHTDIGYTRPQTDILAEHIRYIDYALDYCDMTDGYPEDAKFRWTCESAWAVEEYLKTRPASQVARLKQRVKEGRIELMSMLFNFDELPDETTLAASLKPLETFRKENLPFEVAMQNDVNGIGWCFVDYFADLNVKYLNMGENIYRALRPFPIPTLFKWRSQSGKEIITHSAEHYMHGNTFGIERDDFEFFEVKLLEYLTALEEADYPYDITQVQFSGYTTDNSPPSTQACENIKKWNEKYKFPQLKTAVPTEFFKDIDARYADQLPIYTGAWPDWWTDGFGAGAREAAVSREAHTDIIASLNGFAMAKILGSRIPEKTTEKFDQALRALLFYDEHTVGYENSVRAPYCEQTMEQRALKESYAWQAHRETRIVSETMHGLLQEYVTKGDKPSFVIYNPSSFDRSGIATLYIDHEILPISKKCIVRDIDGNVIKLQSNESRADGTFWSIWVDNVPALGSKQYFIEATEQGCEQYTYQLSDTQEVIEINNPWYDIKIDTKEGVVASIFDRELSAELVDPNAKYGMGEFILENIEDRSIFEYQAESGFTRTPLDSVWYGGCKKGIIYDSYRFNANTSTGIDFKATPNFTMDINVYHSDKRIELAYMIYKAPIIDPEAFYIAMPFQLEDSKIYFEAQGGIIEAGVEQIPGTSNDWNTVQNFSAVRNDKAQIVMVSKEIPFVQFGNINIGRYVANATPESSHIYSWPMNNYWTTNFNADQRGQFSWSYHITSQNSNLNSDATNFSLGVRIPLMGRVLPKSTDPNAKDIASFGSILELNADNIMLVNMKAREDEDAVVLHLRELDGIKTPLNITSDKLKSFSLVKCNVLGEEMGQAPKYINPKEVLFVKVKW